MADFFKGLAGGFGTGLQFGQAMRDRQQREALAQESAKYDVTEGAYGPGLQENIAQVEALKAQDPAQAAAYDQAIAELTRRQGLTAPDYTIGSRAFRPEDNFATRQEARQAALPMRAEGLAGVYRQFGDVGKAEEMETRAADQQRALAEDAYRAKTRPLELQGLQQRVDLGQAQLTDTQRKQNLQAALDVRLADINSQKFDKPEMRTQAILSLVEELQGPQAAAQLRSSYSTNELNEISLNAKKFDEGYRQSRSKGVFSALDWFDEQNADFKLERDPKNPFRITQVNRDGSRVPFADVKNERELGMIIDAKAKPGGWLELAKYDLDSRKAEAAIAKDTAMAGLYAAGGAGAKGGLKQKVADFKEVYGREPSEAEKGVLAGLTNKPREFTSADVNARAKLLVEGGMADPDDPTKTISPQTALQMAEAQLSGQQYVSPVDKLIADMAKAKEAKAAAAPKQGLQQATPAGQQLLNLYNATTPPAPPPRSAPMTQQERLRAMSVPVR